MLALPYIALFLTRQCKDEFGDQTRNITEISCIGAEKFRKMHILGIKNYSYWRLTATIAVSLMILLLVSRYQRRGIKNMVGSLHGPKLGQVQRSS